MPAPLLQTQSLYPFISFMGEWTVLILVRFYIFHSYTLSFIKDLSYFMSLFRSVEIA